MWAGGGRGGQRTEEGSILPSNCSSQCCFLQINIACVLGTRYRVFALNFDAEILHIINIYTVHALLKYDAVKLRD